MITLISCARSRPVSGVVTIDCRELRNPHSIKEFRFLDGRHIDVQSYVSESPGFGDVMEQARKFAREQCPVVIVFQCYAGRHRSVACVEIAARVLEAEGYTVAKAHLELGDSVVSLASLPWARSR